jgi:hypothetical protein
VASAQVLRETLIPERPLGNPAASAADDERDSAICEHLTGRAPEVQAAKHGSVDSVVLAWAEEALQHCRRVGDERSGIAEYFGAYQSVYSIPCDLLN